MFITDINKHLNFLFLEIRKKASELDGKLYYGLINNKQDSESNPLNTAYTTNEINLFKKVVKLEIC